MGHLPEFAKHQATRYPASSMFARLLILLATSLLTAASLSAQGVQPRDEPTAAPPPAPPKAKSRVVMVEKSSLVNRFQINEPRVSEEFNRALLALTRKNNTADAWKSLVSPNDTVGLKINTVGGSILSTHPILVETIVDGLQKAGIRPERIVIWDKYEEQMLGAGYVPMQPQKEWRCLSVIPGAGFDGEKFFFHEVAGQLIWGDRDFIGKAEKAEDVIRGLLEKSSSLDKNAALDPFKATPEDKSTKTPSPPQVSNRSYFTRIVTRDVTKIINIPVLSDHNRIGLNGCIASLALGSIDNHRRFLNDTAPSAEAIAELYANENLHKKTVLHVMDGLIAQYAGGPGFHPHYAASPGLLMLSTDPVAVDALALERVEDWRRTRTIIPVGERAGHIAQAASMGLGNMKPDEIEITVIP
jgi:uncharacterized protein (DUF362 family)